MYDTNHRLETEHSGSEEPPREAVLPFFSSWEAALTAANGYSSCSNRKPHVQCAARLSSSLGSFHTILTAATTISSTGDLTYAGKDPQGTEDVNVRGIPDDNLQKTHLRDLSYGLYRLPTRQRLVAFVKLFKLLDQIIMACGRRLEAISIADPANGVDLETLVAFARRIRCHVRAPPEYDDPTGADVFCVPGYFFPCPDRLMMSRSALFYSGLLRAVPPTITFKGDARSRALFWVVIQTSTPKASIFFTINNAAPWTLYNSAQKPYITGPGSYTVRTYCQAEGFYISEVTVAEFDAPAPEAGDDTVSLMSIRPSVLPSAALPNLVQQRVTTEASSASSKTSGKGSHDVYTPIPEKIEEPRLPLDTQSAREVSTTGSSVVASLAKPAPPKSDAPAKFGGLFLAETGVSDDDEDDDNEDDNDENEDDDMVGGPRK